MNAVGIDVSKNKSMVAVARPLGQVVVKPFEVRHTAIELKKLADSFALPGIFLALSAGFATRN